LSKGTEKALETMQRELPHMVVLALSGNYCKDKKPAATSWIEERGESVAAEAVVLKKVVKSMLKTSLEASYKLNIKNNIVRSNGRECWEYFDGCVPRDGPGPRAKRQELELHIVHGTVHVSLLMMVTDAVNRGGHRGRGDRAHAHAAGRSVPNTPAGPRGGEGWLLVKAKTVKMVEAVNL
ncbi:hypothetical protein C0992_007402, partial [Termitomyces sp. T32_za158]